LTPGYFAIGYTDFTHLAPAYAGLAAYLVGAGGGGRSLGTWRGPGLVGVSPGADAEYEHRRVTLVGEDHPPAADSEPEGLDSCSLKPADIASALARQLAYCGDDPAL